MCNPAAGVKGARQGGALITSYFIDAFMAFSSVATAN